MRPDEFDVLQIIDAHQRHKRFTATLHNYAAVTGCNFGSNFGKSSFCARSAYFGRNKSPANLNDY